MKRRSRQVDSFDITPLIDVVFLLLVFFMTSTVFKKDELALLLSLPKSNSGESTQENPQKRVLIELSIAELAIDGKKVEFTELEEQLKSLQDKNTPIDVRIDKKVEYERIVNLLDILKKMSLGNLSLITEK